MFKHTKTIPLLTEIANRDDLTLADAVVYSALRFKLNLSLNNDKFKDQDGVYIIHQQSEIMADTGISKRKVISAMEKLESPEIGLIRRVKLGRSFKIYFNEYEVDERFLVANKAQNDAESSETPITPNVAPNEIEVAAEVKISANSHIVDNVVDNMGIIQYIDNGDNLIGAEKAPNEILIGAEKAPKFEIGAEKAPYNKIYYNNINIDNKNNKNNFTLPKEPKVIIDRDLYTMFSKCFNKAPNVQVKNAINSLIARGMDKQLIIEIMQEVGSRSWSWGKALDQLNKLANDRIMSLDEYTTDQLGDINVSHDRLAAFRAHVNSLSDDMFNVEPSEWDNVDQITFA